MDFGAHFGSHLDEDAGIAELKYFGEKYFPGISKSRIQHSSRSTAKANDIENGLINLGLGAGIFDEHQHGNCKTSTDPFTCSATRVAAFLNIDHDPAIKELLKYVFMTDKQLASASCLWPSPKKK